MKILICDDEIIYAEMLKDYVAEYMQRKSLKCDISIFENPNDVLEDDTPYQLAFLDIEMGDVDGLTLAKELKKRNGKVVIFFVTSFSQYQDDAMDVRAFRFFEKPINPQRLFLGLDKAMEYIDESYVDFFLYSDNEQKRILVDDVLYVERANRRVAIVTKQGEFIARKNLDEWENELQNSFFFRVHKSFLVNLHYVTNYKYTELTLENGVRIPIAPRR